LVLATALIQYAISFDDIYFDMSGQEPVV